MQIEVKIDSKCKEPKIIILTDKMTEEINGIIKKISEEAPQIITGFKEDSVKILNQSEIIKISSSGGKIFASTEQGEFLLRLRLYELEDRLDKNSFVRISNSEIINLRKATGFDLSFSGTICVKLSDNSVSYVSRRYVKKIKQVLGI